MNNLTRKINHLLHKLWHSISKDIATMLDEMRAIMRNRNYMTRYPKLFSIFAIIEHEQSSQVFDLKSVDFQIIRSQILHDDTINSHRILESLRGLFQSINFDKTDTTKDGILKYIHDELMVMIKSDINYYDLLIRAILRGFPSILTYNNCDIFNKLLNHKSRTSLRLIKYVLDSKIFPSFFVEKEDLANAILLAHQVNNKSAFMMLIKYVRQNDLFSALFEINVNDVKNKILCLSAAEKKGVDYSSVLISYYDNKWFTNEKKIAKMEQFIYEVFSHNLGSDQKQKNAHHVAFSLAISMSQRLGCNNSIVEKILETAVERFIDQKKNNKKMHIKFLAKAKKLDEEKPSTKIKPRDFLAIAPLAPEEYWLLRFANYLL